MNMYAHFFAYNMLFALISTFGMEESAIFLNHVGFRIIGGYSQYIEPNEIEEIRQWMDEKKVIESYSIVLTNGNSATLTKEKKKITCTLRPFNATDECSIKESNFYLARKYYNAKLARITEAQRMAQLRLTLRRRSFDTPDDTGVDLSEWVFIDNDKSMHNAAN